MSTINLDLKYYNKSKKFYKISFYSFIAAFLVPQFAKALPLIETLASVVTVFAVFAVMYCSLRGLIFVIKSYRNKEPFQRSRILYLAGHSFFLLLFVMMMVGIFSDISKLFR